MAFPLVPIGLGAIGAGLLGNSLFGNNDDEQYKNRLDLLFRQTQGRNAPQLGAASQSAMSDFRRNQQGLVTRLEALSRGEGPSLAAQQFRQATDQNMASQQAMAQSGRGGNLAAFNAAANMGNIGAQAAQGSALARTNEQMQAFGQLGGAINQGRQSDEANTQFNALQNNYRDQANLEAKLRTMGMNDEQIRAILQQQGQMAMKPSGWEQLAAGGAGLLAFGASQGKGG